MINLKLHLDVGKSNGIMDLTITDHNGKAYEIDKLAEGKNTLEIGVDTPNKLTFNLSGKDNRRDTILDPSTGKISKDKFIKVLGVEIDGKPLNEHRVAQMFVLETEDQPKQINSAFWGFNGSVKFDLPHQDALDLHLANLG